MPVAIAAVGLIDETVIALAALIMLLALVTIWRPPLEGALSAIPVIGGWVASHVDALLALTQTVAIRLAWPAVGPFVGLVDRVWFASQYLGDHSLRVAQQQYNVTRWIIQALVPYYVSQLTARMDLEFTQSLQFTQLLFTQALQRMDLLFTQALQRMDLLFTQGLQFTQLLFTQALQRMDLLFTQALQYTDASTRAADAYAQQLAADGARYAQQLAGDAMARADAGDIVAERYAEQLAAQVERYSQVLQREAIGYADQVGAQVGAYARSLAVPIAAAVTAIEDSPCMRTCGPLGDLGGLLQQLEDAGLLALLLAFTAEAVSDPEGTAREVRQLVQSPALDLVRQLAGEVGLRVA